ncbi:MAG: hypothetical protein ACLSGS_12820 [Adlercreutzia sp.]
MMLIDDEKSLHMAIEAAHEGGYEYCSHRRRVGTGDLATEAGSVAFGRHDGHERVRLVHAYPRRGRRIPIIFLSAKNDIVDKSIGFRAGVTTT